MPTFKLHRHEVIAPAVRNDGTTSNYPALLGEALANAGFNWTAHETAGCWNGVIEPGRCFTIFAPLRTEFVGMWTADHIGTIARRVMTDQEAIQVTVDPAPSTLIEF